MADGGFRSPFRLPLRASFQAKVLGPVLAMLALLLGGVLWLVDHHLRAEFHRDAVQTLITANAVFHQSRDLRVRHLIDRFRNLPNEPRVKAVLQLGDPATTRALLEELMREAGADGALFVDPEGRLSSAIIPGRQDSGREPQFEPASSGAIEKAMATGEPLGNLDEINGRLYDVISIPFKVGGHPAGVLTLCLEMGTTAAQDFKRLTHTEVVFLASRRPLATTLENGRLNHETLAPLAQAAAHEPIALTIDSERFLGTCGRLPSLTAPSSLGYALMRSYERPLRTLEDTLNRIMGFGLLCITGSMAVLWLHVRGVTQPIRHLRDAAQSIGEGDLTRRVMVRSSDECGELGRVFNQMAENLGAYHAQLKQSNDTLELRVEERTGELRDEIRRREEAQQQLVLASRKAGMADVATEVLHNVGNVLNSLNVSVTVMQENLVRSKLGRFTDAAALLRDHEQDVATYLSSDPRGRLIPDFLIRLATHLTAEQQLFREELAQLATGLEHIKIIVSRQQSHARVSGVTETLPPVAIVEEVLRLQEPELIRLGIRVERRFDAVAPIPMDQHKLTQILVNLVRNAGQALSSADQADRRLVVSVGPSRPGKIAFRVEDNGPGIAPENLIRIFGQGFTTKADGHGFGLHSSALAAHEMGGSLQVASDGLGCGARFTLEIPSVLTQPKFEAA